MHVFFFLLLLLDTVPSDIDDNDSDTASQEATPTSSVESPPEYATSFLPGSERRQVEKRQLAGKRQPFLQHCTARGRVLTCQGVFMRPVLPLAPVGDHPACLQYSTLWNTDDTEWTLLQHCTR